MRTTRTRILFIEGYKPLHEDVARYFAERFPSCDVICCESLAQAIVREQLIEEHPIVIYGARPSDTPTTLAEAAATLRKHFGKAKTVLFIGFDLATDELGFDRVSGRGINTLADIVAPLLPQPPTDQT